MIRKIKTPAIKRQELSRRAAARTALDPLLEDKEKPSKNPPSGKTVPIRGTSQDPDTALRHLTVARMREALSGMGINKPDHVSEDHWDETIIGDMSREDMLSILTAHRELLNQGMQIAMDRAYGVHRQRPSPENFVAPKRPPPAPSEPITPELEFAPITKFRNWLAKILKGT